MLMSLDYDDTYTADITFWLKFIELAKEHGHKIICVTYRNPSEGNKQELKSALPDGVQIIFTDGKAKRETAEKNGFFVDVWIDDQPEMIVRDEK